MNLNTTKPYCDWCKWREAGEGIFGYTGYYPEVYCGYQAKPSQNNTYWVFDDSNDDRVFLSYEEMYEYCINNQYFYKDSDGIIFDCLWEDLNQEQKDKILYRLMI